MGTFPLDTNIVSSGNIPSILMTGYLLGTFPLDTAGMAVYTWIINTLMLRQQRRNLSSVFGFEFLSRNRFEGLIF